MKTTRVQEVIEILKASIEDSANLKKAKPKTKPKKSTKVAKKARKPRLN